jgi:hypothetical protein
VVVECFRIAILFANQQKCGLMAGICNKLDNPDYALGCQYLKFSGQPFSCDRLRLGILNFRRQIKFHLNSRYTLREITAVSDFAD